MFIMHNGSTNNNMHTIHYSGVFNLFCNCCWYKRATPFFTKRETTAKKNTINTLEALDPAIYNCLVAWNTKSTIVLTDNIFILSVNSGTVAVVQSGKANYSHENACHFGVKEFTVLWQWKRLTNLTTGNWFVKILPTNLFSQCISYKATIDLSN